MIKLNNKQGFVNINGKKIMWPIFDEVLFFYNDIATVKLNGKWGLINKMEIL